MLVEIIGYLGMAIVLLSFLARDIKLVRIINIVGSVLCLVYGILTVTIPTAVLNGSLILLNTVMIIIYYKNRRKVK